MQNSQLVLGRVHNLRLWAWGCGKQVKNHHKAFVIMRQRCHICRYAVSVSPSVVSSLFRFVCNPLLFVCNFLFVCNLWFLFVIVFFYLPHTVLSFLPAIFCFLSAISSF